jgi:hypothetical protein|tara:strand:- start:4832 stop:4972 length:141 start_codon:yes stop_codon:yes gene_type:complete
MTFAQDVFGLAILLSLAFWFYSKLKGQTPKDTFDEIRGLFGREESE